LPSRSIGEHGIGPEHGQSVHDLAPTDEADAEAAATADLLQRISCRLGDIARFCPGARRGRRRLDEHDGGECQR